MKIQVTCKDDTYYSDVVHGIERGESEYDVIINGKEFNDLKLTNHSCMGDVWENEYKIFRQKERTKCDNCEKCEFWEYCLGGAFHTWNFDENVQNKCTYNMIYSK